ncbi:hypothetical protein EAH_00068280, partial [Eimeria acervulina]
LCSVQRILPRSKCGSMQDEAHMRVDHCIVFGSCSVVHWVGDGVNLNGGFLALSVYCHAASADECKMRRIRVLKTALDLAAAALSIEWGMGGC